jgi:hypothetical protein
MRKSCNLPLAVTGVQAKGDKSLSGYAGVNKGMEFDQVLSS